MVGKISEANKFFVIGAAEAATGNTIDNIGQVDVTGSGLTQHFWQVQVEVGSFPTSPIPTTTVTVTRAADVCSTTKVAWLNANAGTFYGSVSIPFVGAVERSICTLDDGTATDRIRLYMDAAENLNFETVHNADTDGASDGAGVITVSTTAQIAGAYADDDVRAAVDGTLSAADAAAALPVGDAATTFRVGNDSAGTPFNGHIRALKYHIVRRTDAQIDADTT